MRKIVAVPIGCGHYLPKRQVNNSEFERTIDTTNEWIISRTGIESRHFADPCENTSDLALKAARMALSDAKIAASELDALILATATPDQTFPSTATKVQHSLGMNKGFAFDIQAVCAGFIFALSNANALIKSGQVKKVMVIGAEIFSRILDWSDRSTCILFGDGAGALILEAAENNTKEIRRGILSTDLNSDGKYNDLLFVNGGVATTQTSGFVEMQGREVFKHAVSKLVSTAENSLKAANLSTKDVNWVVPHQANSRIISRTANIMGIDMNKVVMTVSNHGNTSAASIPIALSCSKQQNRFKSGDLLLMKAIGGGLAWGSVAMRW